MGRQYAAGKSQRQIAKHLGVSQLAAAAALARQGVKARDAHAANQKYAVDESVFECDPPSEHAAYFAGFLMADGCVSEDRGALEVGVQERDRDILVAFRSFLRSSHPITTRDRGILGRSVICGRECRVQRQCRFAVRSPRLVASLALYGVVPRKTYTASAPAHLYDNPHFWRGMVDGDGHIALRRQKRTVAPTVGLCGAGDIVEQFSDFVRELTGTSARPLRSRRSGSLWYFSVSNRNAIALLRLMYANCQVALARKLALARQWF